jgi:hypothetical protein
MPACRAGFRKKAVVKTASNLQHAAHELQAKAQCAMESYIVFDCRAARPVLCVVTRRRLDNRCLGIGCKQLDIWAGLAGSPMAVGVAAVMRTMRCGRFVDRWNTRNARGTAALGSGLGTTMLTYVRFGCVRRMVTAMFSSCIRTAMHIVATASKDAVSQDVQ